MVGPLLASSLLDAADHEVEGGLDGLALRRRDLDGVDALERRARCDARRDGAELLEDGVGLLPHVQLVLGADAHVDAVGHEEELGRHLGRVLAQGVDHLHEGAGGVERLLLILVRADDEVGVGEHGHQAVLGHVTGGVEEHIALGLGCRVHELLHGLGVLHVEVLYHIGLLLPLIDFHVLAPLHHDGLLQVGVDDAHVLLLPREVVGEEDAERRLPHSTLLVGKYDLSVLHCHERFINCSANIHIIIYPSKQFFIFLDFRL